MTTPDRPCKHHKLVKDRMTSYVESMLWAERQLKAGRKQRQCPKCKRRQPMSLEGIKPCHTCEAQETCEDLECKKFNAWAESGPKPKLPGLYANYRAKIVDPYAADPESCTTTMAERFDFWWPSKWY